MPELERTLDSLRPADPGALPPSVVVALRSTRRKRRATFIAAAAGVLIPAIAITVALARPRTAPSSGTLVRHDQTPARPNLSSFASLTRANRNLDPERLTLPESSSSAGSQILPTRFRAPNDANESLLN